MLISTGAGWSSGFVYWLRSWQMIFVVSQASYAFASRRPGRQPQAPPGGDVDSRLYRFTYATFVRRW